MSFDSNCRAAMDGTFVAQSSKDASEQQRIAEEKARKLAEAKEARLAAALDKERLAEML